VLEELDEVVVPFAALVVEWRLEPDLVLLVLLLLRIVLVAVLVDCWLVCDFVLLSLTFLVLVARVSASARVSSLALSCLLSVEKCQALKPTAPQASSKKANSRSSSPIEEFGHQILYIRAFAIDLQRLQKKN